MTMEDRIKQNIGQLVFQVLHLQTENELLRQALEEEKKKSAAKSENV